MINQDSKEKIIKDILNEVYELELPIPNDYCLFIISKTIDMTEKALLYDTNKMVSEKIAEIQQKMVKK